jgi:hypothetical protein
MSCTVAGPRVVKYVIVSLDSASSRSTGFAAGTRSSSSA